MWEFIEDLIAVGWQVKGSGDGTGGNYENEGQTAGSSGTGSGGGYHVHPDDTTMYLNQVSPSKLSPWVRLATPTDHPSPHEIVFVLNDQIGGSYQHGQWRMVYFRDGNADTGASAGQQPSTTVPNDGQAFGYANDGTANGFPFWAPAASGKMHWVIGDKSENYDFMWIVTDVNGEVFSIFGQLYLLGANGTASNSDLDPMVYFSVKQSSEASTPTSRFLTDNSISHVSGSDTSEENDTTTFQNGIFASFHYNDPNKETYMVGACQPFGRDGSGTIVPAYQVPAGEYDNSNRYVLYNPIWFGKFGGTKRFLKGVYLGKLFQWALDETGPELLDDGTDRYATFHGIAIKWDPLVGLET